METYVRHKDDLVKLHDHTQKYAELWASSNDIDRAFQPLARAYRGKLDKLRDDLRATSVRPASNDRAEDLLRDLRALFAALPGGEREREIASRRPHTGDSSRYKNRQWLMDRCESVHFDTIRVLRSLSATQHPGRTTHVCVICPDSSFRTMNGGLKSKSGGTPSARRADAPVRPQGGAQDPPG